MKTRYKIIIDGKEYYTKSNDLSIENKLDFLKPNESNEFSWIYFILEDNNILFLNCDSFKRAIFIIEKLETKDDN